MKNRTRNNIIDCLFFLGYIGIFWLIVFGSKEVDTKSLESPNKLEAIIPEKIHEQR